jgi:hypothetical protein
MYVNKGFYTETQLQKQTKILRAINSFKLFLLLLKSILNTKTGQLQTHKTK